MLSDNLGYGDLGCYGGGIIRGAPTPNIDQLASEGIRFTNFNVESECTPSRSALMTGRYAVRSGTTRAVPIQGIPQGMAPWEVTVAEALKEKGYNTAIYGKWHIGVEKGRFPTDQGFDEWWGITNSTDVVSWPTRVGFDSTLIKPFNVLGGTTKEGVKPVMAYNMEARPLMDEIIQQKSVDYIKQQANNENPFFLYIPWIAVHHPPIPHPDFKGKSGNGDFSDMMIEHDYRVGQIVKAVEDAGLSENTIIVYAVSITDFMPTLTNLVGGNIPKDRAYDGVDQKGLFFENTGKSQRDGVLFFHDETFVAAKWRQFKIYFQDEGVMQEERTYHDLWAPQVFNIMQDPKELHDIGLRNLWIVGPALSQLVPFYASVRQFGLVESGAAQPSPGEVIIPFTKSAQLKELFDKMLAQAKARAMQKAKEGKE